MGESVRFGVAEWSYVGLDIKFVGLNLFSGGYKKAAAGHRRSSFRDISFWGFGHHRGHYIIMYIKYYNTYISGLRKLFFRIVVCRGRILTDTLSVFCRGVSALGNEFIHEIIKALIADRH